MEPTELKTLLEGIAVIDSRDETITEVVTDSRLASHGSLFVAIEGDRLDGHDFIKDAFCNGAAAAVVSRRMEAADGWQIVVPDTKDAHIGIAKNYKRQFDILSVAITGSVGKTTTKEMTAVILEQFGRTLKNDGNLNNEVGLPKTVFEINRDVKYAVFEMGMNQLGDISKLTEAVKPDAAIITGIGVSHIEYLKTRENILKAKLEVTEGMSGDGLLVLNGDDELLMKARGGIQQTTATFAVNNKDADVTAADIMIRPKQSEFTIMDKKYGNFSASIPAVGNHNIMDALSAYTLTTRMGFDPERSADALEKFRTIGMRQHIVEFRGITVIEDCYNANPDSMYAALAALSAMQVDGIRIAILGDMLELGSLSEREHYRLGMLAAKSSIDVLLCIGENMKYTAEAARAAKITSVEWFGDKRSLADYLSRTAHAGDAVFIKGSRGMRLEDILDMFYRR